MSIVKLGLIGCGRAAERLYIPALAHVKNLRLIAVCDPSAERRRLIAGRADGCVASENPSEMLDAADLDAVAVLTPPELHLETARPALMRGLPVLIEKPLAATFEQALSIRQLAEDHGATVALGFNRRWWEPVRRLAEAMRQLSGPAEIEMSITSDATQWGAFCGVRDALDDLASHHLDLLVAIIGASVASVAAQQEKDGAVTLHVLLAGGHRAKLFAAQRSPSTESISIRRAGHHFRLDISSVRITPAAGVLRRTLDFADRFKRKVSRGPSPMAQSYRLQLAAFSRLVESGDSPPSNLRTGLDNMRILEAARQSLQSGGKPVTITYE